jgi:DNA mismatch repair ATPase MutL
MKKLLTLAAILLMGTVVTFGLKAHALSAQSGSQQPSTQQQPSTDQQQPQMNEQQKNEQQSTTHEKPSPNQGVNYQAPKKIREKAMNPTPASNATQQSKKSSIGKGKTTMNTSKDNSFWVEQVDLDGTGHPVDTQMMWDDTDKVLYAAGSKTFQCKDGASASGDLLMATYAKGNKAGKPTGSGWWMASSDQSACKMSTEQAYGCKFDATGKNTACGMATLDDQTHEMTIVEAATTSIR